MKTSGATLEDAVALEADKFAEAVESISGSDPNLRSAVMQMAPRDAIWSASRAFPEAEYETADFLEIMPALLRDSAAAGD